MTKKRGLLILLLSSSLVTLLACNQSSNKGNVPLLVTHIITIDGVEREIIDGEKAPLITPSDNDEQVFVCWMANGEEFNPDTPITSSITITSSWRDRYIYSVYFDEISTEVKEGFKVEKPQDPVKEGYEFVGWYEDAKPFDFDTLIYRDYHLSSRFSDEIIDDEIDYEHLDYVDLGSVGGANSREYNLGIYRDKKNLILKYTASENEMFAKYGVDFFIQIGEVESSTRTANSFLFTASESGAIKIYNYPLNTKKTISSSQYRDNFGFEVHTSLDESGVSVYAKAPLSFFKNFVSNDTFDEYSPIGIAFNSVDSSTGKYDVYKNYTYLGFNNNAEVNRSDPRDYLRFSHFGSLFDATTNKFDTFIDIHSNVKSGSISYLNKSGTTNSNGDYSFSLKRNELKSIDVLFDSKFYADSQKEIVLTKDVNYEVNFNLETKKENVTFKITSLDGSTPIEGVSVSCNGNIYQSDVNGTLVIPNLDVSEGVVLSLEKDGYVSVNKSYVLVADIVDLINEIRLPALTDSLTISGQVYDQSGNKINNAKIQLGSASPVYTNNNGEYVIETTFEEKDITIEADGYLTLNRHINPIDSQNNNYNFNFEMTLDYVSLGNVGGSKAYKFSISATRNSEELLFKFETTTTIDKELYPTSGVAVFLTFGKIRKTSGRDERTFIITCYGTANDYFAYYPDGTKTNLNEENNIVGRAVGESISYLSIPFNTFDKSGIEINSLDDIGISFTSDKGSGYDTYSSSMLGFNNATQVDRTNALDYLSWTKNNEIQEYTNYIMNESTLNELFRGHPNFINGKDFSTNRAEIETSNGTIENLVDDAHMFTDRLTQKYDWDADKAPVLLFDGTYKYTFCPISSGSAFRVTKAGYVMLLVPNTSSYSTLKNAVKNEWGEFVLYSWNKCNSLSDNLNYAIKWCEVGESFNYGKFTIAII